MAKLLSPNLRIDWYPEGHFHDPHYPRLSELNSGYNLSREVLASPDVGFGVDNTEDTSTIYDNFETQSVLNHTYEANLRFFFTKQSVARTLFYNMNTPTGYIGKRFGYPCNVPFDEEETTHTFDLFKVQADLPKVYVEDGTQPVLDIKYIPLGEAYKVSLVNYTTYNELTQTWTYGSYTRLQDAYTGRTYEDLNG